MKTEKLINKTASYGLNVSGGKVNSLRVNEDMKTVIRVYSDGKIGVAGRIGEGDDGELLKDAQSGLSQNIAYPCNLDGDKKRSVNRVKHPVPAGEFVKTMKKLLARLNAEYPDFIFSNKINMEEFYCAYENSENTSYSYSSDYLAIVLVIQHKQSSNIMDLAYDAVQDCYDEDKVVSDIGKLLSVFKKHVVLDANLPVIIGKEVIYYALNHLVAELYVSGASLFKDKLGSKVFDERVNIFTYRGEDSKQCIPFFDSEGVTVEGDKFHFVKDGVLCGLATYKRSAANFNLPLSGGGYAEFDGVPSASIMGVEVGKTSDSLKELVKGKAIYVYQTSGGDMTPDGTLGIPVQVAYLYEDGKLIGRLPEFTMNANIFDLLGKDFIGAAANDAFGYREETVVVGKFKIM